MVNSRRRSSASSSSSRSWESLRNQILGTAAAIGLNQLAGTGTPLPIKKRGNPGSSMDWQPTSQDRKGKGRADPSPGQEYVKNNEKRKRRSYGAITSKSKGRFNPGTKKKKFYLDKKTAGVSVCREMGDATALTTNAQSVLVGHATCTVEHTMFLVACAISKFWAIKNDLQWTELSQFILPTIGYSTRVVNIYGKAEPKSVTSSTVLTTNIIGASTTWLSFVTDIATKLRDFFRTNPYGLLTQLQDEISGSGIVYKTYDLRRAKVLLTMKSTLKIQNRTKSVSGATNDDDVDNVPIYGKSYSGSGNFIGYNNYDSSGRNVEYIMPASSQTSGDVKQTYLAGVMSEPPRVSQLVNVSKSGKAHLDPGEIKTSVVYHTIKIGLNQLFIKLKMHASQTPLISLGNFRYFVFEKMIKTGTDIASQTMSIGYELDEKSYCVFTAPKIFVENTQIILAN